MAITPSDFEKIWSSNASTPAYNFTDADYFKGWDCVGNLPPTRAQWNAIQKRTDEKMKYIFDNFGSPLVANTVADMTEQNRVYVYTGSEVGYTAGHWYFYDAGTSTWADGGVYNAVVVQTDKTLTLSDEPADAEVVGWNFDNFVYEKTPTTLPADVNGKFYLGADISNYVVCGTHNVAELLNLHQGTTTINDVTITVDGNTVTASGTASADVYYGYVDGTNKTTTELKNMDLGLPVIGDQYTLSMKKISTETTQNPSVSVRSKSSGSLVTAQNNVATFTMDTTTCGGLYTYFQSGRTYDITFVIALFPYVTTTTNVYREQLSDVTVYNQDGYYDLSGYAWSVGSPTVTFLKTRLPRKPLFKYSSLDEPQLYTGAIELLDIYIPVKDGYIDYAFGRTITSATQSQGGGNVWRFIQATKVNNGFIREYYITALGETEMAIRILGRDDFIGGFTHGDEWLDSGSALFLLDGESVTISDYTTLTEFDELQVFATNTMYDPADHTTVVGKHGVSWKFTKDGLEIGQSVDFSTNVTLLNSYLGMVCAIRNQYSSQTLQITDTYVDDGNFTQYDVSSEGFTSYPADPKIGINKVYLIGKTQKLMITTEYIRQVNGLQGEGCHLFNGASYNKLYNAVCGYPYFEVPITSGTKWQTEMKISIEASQ